MKYLTLFYEGNKIEVHNTIWGKESIFYNEELVSSKHSLLGSKHHFQVEEANENANYEVVVTYNTNGIAFCVYRNQQPILLQ